MTASVLLNFNLFLKKRITGRPIRDTTTEIAMYTITDCILNRKNKIKKIPRIMPRALKIPVEIIFEFNVLNFKGKSSHFERK